MKQLASPLAVERPAWPKARPGEGDFEGLRSLDSCLRRNDTRCPSIRLKCYAGLILLLLAESDQHAVIFQGAGIADGFPAGRNIP